MPEPVDEQHHDAGEPSGSSGPGCPPGSPSDLQHRGQHVGQRPAAVVRQREGDLRHRPVARDSAAAKPSTRATASAPSAASLTRSAMSSADAVPV